MKRKITDFKRKQPHRNRKDIIEYWMELNKNPSEIKKEHLSVDIKTVDLKNQTLEMWIIAAKQDQSCLFFLHPKLRNTIGKYLLEKVFIRNNLIQDLDTFEYLGIINLSYKRRISLIRTNDKSINLFKSDKKFIKDVFLKIQQGKLEFESYFFLMYMKKEFFSLFHYYKMIRNQYSSFSSNFIFNFLCVNKIKYNTIEYNILFIIWDRYAIRDLSELLKKNLTIKEYFDLEVVKYAENNI